MDWLLIISILGSHFKADLIDKNLNFFILGIRSIISTLFLWDYEEIWKNTIHTNYFKYVVKVIIYFSTYRIKPLTIKFMIMLEPFIIHIP